MKGERERQIEKENNGQTNKKSLQIMVQWIRTLVGECNLAMNKERERQRVRETESERVRETERERQREDILTSANGLWLERMIVGSAKQSFGFLIIILGSEWTWVQHSPE